MTLKSAAHSILELQMCGPEYAVTDGLKQSFRDSGMQIAEQAALIVMTIRDPRLCEDSADSCEPQSLLDELHLHCTRLAVAGGGAVVLLISQQLLDGDESLPLSSIQAATAHRSLNWLARTYGPADVRVNAVVYRDFASVEVPTLWLLSADASYVTGQSLLSASTS